MERHVEETCDSELMFEPLQHLIGAGEPRAVITEMQMEIPDSQADLNEEQKKVAVFDSLLFTLLRSFSQLSYLSTISHLFRLPILYA